MAAAPAAADAFPPAVQEAKLIRLERPDAIIPRKPRISSQGRPNQGGVETARKNPGQGTGGVVSPIDPPLPKGKDLKPFPLQQHMNDRLTPGMGDLDLEPERVPGACDKDRRFPGQDPFLHIQKAQGIEGGHLFLLLLPAAYMFFQALLPLRQSGIDIDPALGLSGMFFGNTANAGPGLSFWFITVAGVLLVAAGFITPPRGWGRLFTFLLMFGAVLGISFFCAASYNWNLFISQSAAGLTAAGGTSCGMMPIRFLALL